MAATEVRSLATGAVLGSVAPVDLEAAAAAARTAQPLWSLIPVASRARYVKRTAVAMLDELDDLALLLAEETGWPRAHLVLSELLPAVEGLNALADEGPRALADRRLSPRRARLAGRSTRLVQSPVGVVGLRGPSASPWLEPALEAAAALLAGNGVLLTAGAPLAAERLRTAFLRAGLPGELLATAPAAAALPSTATAAAERPDLGRPSAATAAAAGDLDGVCDRVVDLPAPARTGTLLVLEGARRSAVVEAALWAAFAGSGNHPAAAGRLVMVEGAVPALVDALRAAAAALRVGDPRAETTDIGPLPDGTSATPTVLDGLSPDDPRFLAPPPLTLAVVEVATADEAVRLAARADGPVSIWARDAAKGDRVARRLPAVSTWIGRHGLAPTSVPVRLARHVVPRQIEWRAAWAPGMPTLPPGESLVVTRTALAEVRHGRESRRWPALRALVRSQRAR